MFKGNAVGALYQKSNNNSIIEFNPIIFRCFIKISIENLYNIGFFFNQSNKIILSYNLKNTPLYNSNINQKLDLLNINSILYNKNFVNLNNFNATIFKKLF